MYAFNVIFVLFFVSMVSVLGFAIGSIVISAINQTKAREQFAPYCSVLPRAYAERLVANCNDSSNSTVLEALAIIEKDAREIKDEKTRNNFLSQFKQDSANERIKVVRATLEVFYLPKAISAQADH